MKLDQLRMNFGFGSSKENISTINNNISNNVSNNVSNGSSHKANSTSLVFASSSTLSSSSSSLSCTTTNATTATSSSSLFSLHQTKSEEAICQETLTTVTNHKNHSSVKAALSSSLLEEIKAYKGPMSKICNNSNNINNKTVIAAKNNDDNSIASSYFQSKYHVDQPGANKSAGGQRPPENLNKADQGARNSMMVRNNGLTTDAAALNKTNGNNRASSTSSSSSSKAVPAAAPDDRGSRASSMGRGGGGFSYLSLLPSDGSFPHRTQPIGGVQTSSRRSSLQSQYCGSTEYLNSAGGGDATKNYMVRSNPIGLAEPSMKRDGYAVGRDGSLYRSSENLLIDNSVQSRGGSDSRRGSTGGHGIRTGGGLIETGRPATGSMFMMPFGSGCSSGGSGGAVKASDLPGLLKRTNGSNRSQSHSSVHRKSKDASSSSSSSSTSGNYQHQQLQISTKKAQATSSVLSSSVQLATMTSMTTTSTTTTETSETSSLQNNSRQVEEHNMSFTVARKGPLERARSMSSRARNDLPDQTITVSLPGSRRASRQASMDRDNLKRSGRSPSVEVFTGEFTMTMPSSGKAPKGTKAQGPAKITEIYSDTYRYTASSEDCDTSNSSTAADVVNLGKPPIQQRPPPSLQAQPQNKSLPVVKETASKEPDGMTMTSRLKTSDGAATTNMVVSNNTITSSHSVTTTSETNHSTSMTSTSSSAERRLLAVEGDQGLEVRPSKVDRHQNQQASTTSSRTCHQSADSDSGRNLTTSVTSPPCATGANQGSSAGESSKCSQTKDKVINKVHQTKRTSSSLNGGSVASAVTSSSAANGFKVGDHLKGLDVALEALAKQQRERELKELAASGVSSSGAAAAAAKRSGKKRASSSTSSVSVTVSLPASKRPSRRNSVGSLGGGGVGSRRNSSLDLYKADYDVKLSRSGSEMALHQRSVTHIKLDDKATSKIKLCGRCHDPQHQVEGCQEFGHLLCPRCMEWDHWEDTCPAAVSAAAAAAAAAETNQGSPDAEDRPETTCCKACKRQGHLAAVHQATDFKQRRMIVDTLGWEGFEEWFYESEFRSWWQLNGCVGVPLYKLYRRNREWRNGGVVLDDDGHDLDLDGCHDLDGGYDLVSRVRRSAAGRSKNDLSTIGRGASERNGISKASATLDNKDDDVSLEDRASYLAARYKANYGLKRDDSTEELLKRIKMSSRARRTYRDCDDDDNVDVQQDDVWGFGKKVVGAGVVVDSSPEK